MTAMLRTLKAFDRATFEQIPGQCKVRLSNEEHFARVARECTRAKIMGRLAEISRNPSWTFSLWTPEELQLRAEPIEGRFEQIIDKNLVSPVFFHRFFARHSHRH
jgi:hypothetical protein